MEATGNNPHIWIMTPTFISLEHPWCILIWELPVIKQLWNENNGNEKKYLEN